MAPPVELHTSASLAPSKIQILPFCISYNGPFDPTDFEITHAPYQSSSSSSSEQDSSSQATAETCLKAAFRGRQMLSRDFPLPQGYTGLVVRVNAPKLSSDVLQQRRPAPLKRKPALSTLAPDPKRHRTSPRKAKPLTRARPKFSMDSDDEQEPVDQEEEEEDGSQPVIDSAQSSQTLVEDPEHQQQQQQQQEEEDPQQEEQVKDVAVQLKPLGKFDEMRIWSADAELDEGQDAIVRNMREWYSMAELIHS